MIGVLKHNQVAASCVRTREPNSEFVCFAAGVYEETDLEGGLAEWLRDARHRR